MTKVLCGIFFCHTAIFCKNYIRMCFVLIIWFLYGKTDAESHCFYLQIIYPNVLSTE